MTFLKPVSKLWPIIGASLLLAIPGHSFIVSKRYVQLSAPARKQALTLRSIPDGVSFDSIAPEITSEATEALNTAKVAAQEAGKAILASCGKMGSKTKFNEKDLVTEVDVACQKIVEDHLESGGWTAKGHTILGEEAVAPGMAASAAALNEAMGLDGSGKDTKKLGGWMWVVDPIDGTTNFVMGMPLSAISIGICYEGRVVAACIYDPFQKEMFTAVAGQGAMINNEPMGVGTEENLVQAVLAAGAPPSLASLQPSLRGINALAPKVRTVRLIGSAAIMLAWVACGRHTLYFEPDLNSWDIAAGALLVHEAGGKITDLDGTPYKLTTRAILASNSRTHDETLSILQSVNAIRCDEI